MRWVFAGLLFALAVVSAIGTAAMRAENVRMRHSVERAYREVQDRIVELRRLEIDRLKDASPERLSIAHWAHLHAEAARLKERVQ